MMTQYVSKHVVIGSDVHFESCVWLMQNIVHNGMTQNKNVM